MKRVGIGSLDNLYGCFLTGVVGKSRLDPIRVHDEEKCCSGSAKVAAFKANTCADFYGALLVGNG